MTSCDTVVLRLHARLTDALLDVMTQGVADGTFSVSDPTLATIAIGGMDVQVAHWFNPDQPYPAEVVADQYARFALRIVGLDR
ncbi:hypothetical protein AB0I60_02740 [Actinosynnema sp. NPDC050436]|uniref:hypothetical protein n=1 Tax=Actinosynnema sp. NPDC050436 TaxID=3155659 RepID=UPI0033E61A04